MLLVMQSKISSKGQILLPASIREQDDIKAGQRFEIVRVGRGIYCLTRKGPAKNKGLVDWLLKCPVKGFFVPIESESTDTL